MLGCKLHIGTSKTKAGQAGLVRVALFLKVALCNLCFSMCDYHVTGSPGGPVVLLKPTVAFWRVALTPYLEFDAKQ